MRGRARDPKTEELVASRTLNPHPEAVQDGAFASGEFFDARDLVQVKYEMVRRVAADGVTVTEVPREHHRVAEAAKHPSSLILDGAGDPCRLR